MEETAGETADNAPEVAALVAGAVLVSVSREGDDGARFVIDRDPFDLGRTLGAVTFDDPHLAARHARVQRRDGGYMLTALDTINGVYVRLRAAVELVPGDRILLGRQVLLFELVSAMERTMGTALEQGVALFGTPVREPWGRLRQMTAAGVARDVHHLTRTETTLGREQGDIVFGEDEFLSRRHAQIQSHDGRVTLQDLGSSNGTYLRLREEHLLQAGDLVRIGDELLRFEIG